MESPSLEAIAASPTVEYEKAYVNFIYSFSWDVTKISFKDLADELAPKPPKPTRKHQWTLDQLHRRYMDFDGDDRSYGAYRPSLLTGCQDALYYTKKASLGLEVITPLGDDWIKNEGLVRSCNVSLKYYIRLLENGAGVCTLSAGLVEGNATFENIHSVLHLGDNLSFGEQNEKTKTALPHVCSYLRRRRKQTGECWANELHTSSVLPVKDRSGAEITLQFYRDLSVNGEELPKDVFSLQEIVNRLLLTNDGRLPDSWFVPEDAKDLKAPDLSRWLDWELLEWPRNNAGEYEINYPWQNPYVFTICEMPKPIKGERFSAQTVVSGRAREVASILTKMNLNNDRITKDFQCMGDDYVSHALPFNRKRKALRNLSHDDRLFFTFSRRGALAITARMDTIPGYFVLPSFVNLLEILRARWHLGNVVNLELDAAIEKLVSVRESPTSVALKAVHRARTMLAMFLRDPVPYLFDGGAVTEIAQLAETELWLSRLRICAGEKLTALDKLIQHAQLAKAYSNLEEPSDPSDGKRSVADTYHSLLDEPNKN